MRTAFNLDDDLLGEAQRLTGMTERTALIHASLVEHLRSENATLVSGLGAGSADGVAVDLRVDRR